MIRTDIYTSQHPSGLMESTLVLVGDLKEDDSLEIIEKSAVIAGILMVPLKVCRDYPIPGQIDFEISRVIYDPAHKDQHLDDLEQLEVAIIDLLANNP